MLCPSTNLNRQNESLDSSEVLRRFGLDGDWFDVHDVEGYLQEKGIYATGNMSFYSALCDVLPLPREKAEIDMLESVKAQADMSTPSSSSAAAAGAVADYQYYADMCCDPKDLSTCDVSTFPSVRLFDVSKFIKRMFCHCLSYHLYRIFLAVPIVNSLLIHTAGLVQRGICLGSCPGFRRVDVERAFQLGVLEAV